MSSMIEKQCIADGWLEFGGVAIAKAALSSQFQTSRFIGHNKTFPKHHHM